MYIGLDGIDGSGKSTVAKILAEQLGCKLVAQPSPDHLGPVIRKVLRGEIECSDEELMSMFVGDRVALYKDVVEPEIEAGRHVVCDRSALSTYAFQGQSVCRKLIRDMHNRFVPKNDLALLIALDVDVAQKRLAGRAKQEIFDGDVDLQRAAADLYLDAAHNHYECFTNDIEVIDGSQDIDAIVKEALEVIRACEGET
jgi:dTMP kinase